MSTYSSCGCGQRGCAEAYVSASSVVRRFRELSGSDSVTEAREVFTLAAKGDEQAELLVNEVRHT